MIINNCLASPTASRADCQLRAADTIKAPPGAASPRGVLTTPTPLHSPAGLRPNFAHRIETTADRSATSMPLWTRQPVKVLLDTLGLPGEELAELV